MVWRLDGRGAWAFRAEGTILILIPACGGPVITGPEKSFLEEKVNEMERATDDLCKALDKAAEFCRQRPDLAYEIVDVIQDLFDEAAAEMEQRATAFREELLLEKMWRMS